jgi:hypothetical protein
LRTPRSCPLPHQFPVYERIAEDARDLIPGWVQFFENDPYQGIALAMPTNGVEISGFSR